LIDIDKIESYSLFDSLRAVIYDENTVTFITHPFTVSREAAYKKARNLVQ